ncbi:MAG: ABC transporter substrate-binding protein [Propionibacterium sp.]
MPVSRRTIVQMALASIPVIGLSACSSGSSSSSSGSATGGESGTISVGFSQVGAESGWRTANTQSIKDNLTDAKGFKLTFVDAQQKQENQIKALRDFIDQGMDVIAFSPVIQTGWDQVLGEIKDAKIPLVLTDRAVTTSVTDPYQGFIGSDFKHEGVLAGNWVKQNAADAKIFELQGTMGSAPQVDRQSGFDSIMGSQIIGRASGNFTRAEGKTAMEAALQSYPSMNLVFSHNDDMALGALEAISAAGKTAGTDIKIVSCDAVKDGLQALHDKKFNFVVECNPLFGDQLADLIKKVHGGQSSTTQTVVNETTFDQTITQATIDARKY